MQLLNIIMNLLQLLQIICYYTPAISAQSDLWWQELGVWWQENTYSALAKQMYRPQTGPAKNVVIFTADGLDGSLIHVARLFEAEQLSEHHEGVQLAFELFPHFATLKSYCVDAQVSDPSAALTSLLTGVKVNRGTAGVGPEVTLGQCEKVSTYQLPSLLRIAQIASKATGLVTNEDLTSTSVAPVYAASANASWQSDGMIDISGQFCRDNAIQLLDETASKMRVILGGGKDHLLHLRKDGVNIPEEWAKELTNGGRKSTIVYNKADLENIGLHPRNSILGLFADREMPWSRESSRQNLPTLELMTSKAIDLLLETEAGSNGIFLQVHAGLIGKALEQGLIRRAFEEISELNKAVKVAVEKLPAPTTLVLVMGTRASTIVHHGNPTRHSPIISFVDNMDMKIALQKTAKKDRNSSDTSSGIKASDGLSIPSLISGPGPGYINPRVQVNESDFSNTKWKIPTTVPYSRTLPGLQDTLLFATGAQSHRFSGVLQNVFPFYILQFASCLNPGYSACTMKSTGTQGGQTSYRPPVRPNAGTDRNMPNLGAGTGGRAVWNSRGGRGNAPCNCSYHVLVLFVSLLAFISN